VTGDRPCPYAEKMAEWSKRIRRTGGAEGGWREEFPLNRDMPEILVIDCDVLELPVYPLFWLRLRTFLDWHHAQGRSLSVFHPPMLKPGRALTR